MTTNTGRLLGAAITIAGLLISGAVIIGPHWEISASAESVYLLDRWSGEITECYVPANVKREYWSKDTEGLNKCEVVADWQSVFRKRNSASTTP